MPQFSVVMATYNRGRHILPSIRSVLNQHFRDFELIVVGDCCDDETAEVVRPFLGGRVRWFNLGERCGSQSFPNNEGIARSAGDVIAYLGHDDVWTPDHLQSLATLFQQEPSLDFAVSGAIYHGPEGSDFRQVTGLFDDPTTPFEHFFPPSSFAHRRDVTERIGPWKHQMAITAPVDADLLLRAAHAGMRFRSTQRVTLHKFAAGHRYLSYLAQESVEQEEMLQKIESADYRAAVTSEVEKARADGSFMGIRHPDFDTFEKGALARANAMGKGNIRPQLRPLIRREVITQDDLPRALDWQGANGPVRIRWVGRNPRPKILLEFSSSDPVRVQITIAHADPAALERLTMSINSTRFDMCVSKPQQRDEAFEAIATVSARLRPSGYSIVELLLTDAQRLRGPQAGIGVGEIILTPLGLRALRRRAGAAAAGYLSRAARKLTPASKPT